MFTNSKGAFTIDYYINYNIVSLQFVIQANGFKDFIFKRSIPFDKNILDLGDIYLDNNKTYTYTLIDSLNNKISNANVNFYKSYKKSPVVQKMSDIDGIVSVTEQELLINSNNTEVLGLHIIMDNKKEAFINQDSLIEEQFINQVNGQNNINNCNYNIIINSFKTYKAKVIDDIHKEGIKDARVSLKALRNAFDFPLDKFDVLTDNYGQFEMKIPILYREQDFFIEVIANNYCSAKIITDPYPSTIELDKYVDFIDCLVINSKTSKPLINETLKTDNNRSYKTNNDGHLLFPIKSNNNKIRILLFSKDFDLVFNGFTVLNTDEYGRKSTTIIMDKVVSKVLKVYVRDELNLPISGAKVKIQLDDLSNSITNNLSITDCKGVASFEGLFTNSNKINFDISHSLFPILDKDPVEPTEIKVDELNKNEIEYYITLKRGILLQNIHVVSDNNINFTNTKVYAELFDENGNNIVLSEITNDNGTCDIAFPVFDKGIIYVDKRPDTIIHLNYNMILANNNITLIVPRSIKTEYLIEGIIHDSTGLPLNNVKILLKREDSRGWELSKSNNNGKYKFIAFKGIRYNIMINNHMNNGYFYEGKKVTNVYAGDQVDIEITKYNGVQIYLTGIKEVFFDKITKNNYDVWIAERNGKIINPIRIIKDDHKVTFIGIPDGQYKVFVQVNNNKI